RPASVRAPSARNGRDTTVRGALSTCSQVSWAETARGGFHGAAEVGPRSVAESAKAIAAGAETGSAPAGDTLRDATSNAANAATSKAGRGWGKGERLSCRLSALSTM